MSLRDGFLAAATLVFVSPLIALDGQTGMHDPSSVWWVNGTEAVGVYNDRQTVIDDGVAKRLTLKKGANIVRAAVVNAGGATDFCARFLDRDDAPVKGIAVDLLER